jgi:hypothetical protein
MKQEAPEAQSFIFILKAKALPDSYAQFQKLYRHSITDAELKEQGEVEELFALAETGRKGILVANFSDREELLSLLNLMPRLQPLIVSQKLVVMVFAKVMSNKIETVLEKSGCASVLKYEIPARGFIFKLKRHLTELNAGDVAAKESLEKAKKASKRAAWDAESSPAKKKPNQIHFRDLGNQVRLSPPLLTLHDFWLFRKRPYIRRYKGNWMVELIGPSPASGKWKLSSRFSGLFPDSDTIWEWGRREPPGKYGDTFNPATGTWVFVGKKPEYSWVVNRWAFISEVPGLYFIEDGKVLEVRFFETDEGILDMSDNSAAAIEAFPKIQETYDQDYYLELERLEKQDMSITLDPPPNLPWTDRLDSADIPPPAWKQHDLNKEEGPEWGEKKGAESESEAKEKAPHEAAEEFTFPIGAQAMRDCGLKAVLRGEEIELLSYSEESPLLSFGGPLDLKLKEAVSLEIRSENLGGLSDFKLVGVISSADKDETGRGVFQLSLHPDSHKNVGKIREAIERRQAEVLDFFKKAKGM